MQLDKRLGLLGQGVVREIRVLGWLLRARQWIDQYAFQDACITLFQCKQELVHWKKACQQVDYLEVCLFLSISKGKQEFF